MKEQNNLKKILFKSTGEKNAFMMKNLLGLRGKHESNKMILHLLNNISKT